MPLTPTLSPLTRGEGVDRECGAACIRPLDITAANNVLKAQRGLGAVMRCLACGAEMDLIEVVPDTTKMVRGYEHQTWQCSSCSETERRLVFSGPNASSHPQKFPARERPAAPLAPPVPAAMPAAARPDQRAEVASAWRRTFAKLRARQADKR